MRFLSRHANIPVPIILGAGRWGCGLYIVMTVLEGTLLSKRLRYPMLDLPSLKPNILYSDIGSTYRGIA